MFHLKTDRGSKQGYKHLHGKGGTRVQQITVLCAECETVPKKLATIINL